MTELEMPKVGSQWRDKIDGQPPLSTVRVMAVAECYVMAR